MPQFSQYHWKPSSSPGAARALDDQAHGVGGAPRRVRHVRRQQEDLAFADRHVHALAVLDGGERDAALELVEEFLARVDVEIACGRSDRPRP